MNILIFDFGSYTYTDIIEAFNNLGIRTKTVTYCFNDKNNDEFFQHRFSNVLSDGDFDAVFSVNFFPLVAKCCHEKNIKYISWSYDNPLNVPNIEETLNLSSNYTFLFDRIQASSYINKGFESIFHLPLAVNTKRLDKIHLTETEIRKYSSDISFVGKLYSSDYELYLKLMSEYQRGFVEGLVNTQQNLYGCYILDETIDEDFISKINSYIKASHPESNFALSKEALLYSMSANITRNERLILLGILSKRYDLRLYSREDNAILKNAKFMGSCGYLQEMPRVFKASKINLNITLKMLQSGIPLRALDIIGSGGFLLSNYQPELAEFFENGSEVVMYESIEDAVSKADFYLKHPEERQKIAANAHAKAATYFTYESRIKDMLEIADIQ